MLLELKDEMLESVSGGEILIFEKPRLYSVAITGPNPGSNTMIEVGRFADVKDAAIFANDHRIFTNVIVMPEPEM